MQILAPRPPATTAVLSTGIPSEPFITDLRLLLWINVLYIYVLIVLYSRDLVPPVCVVQEILGKREKILAQSNLAVVNDGLARGTPSEFPFSAG